MLSFYLYKLTENIETYEGKILMVDEYMVDEVLHKIKEIISIEKLGDTKILINADDYLSDGITFKKSCDIIYMFD